MKNGDTSRLGIIDDDVVIQLELDKYPEQIRDLRRKKALTQAELAEKAGVSQQAISAIENGRLDPSLKMLVAIAAILGAVLLIGSFLEKGRD